MKTQKIISILIYFTIILIIFVLGYFYSKMTVDKLEKKQINGIKWEFNSSNKELNINLSNEKIAPGMDGDFFIEIDAAKSETNLEYEINVKEEKNIPKNLNFVAKIKDGDENIILETEKYNNFLELATQNLNGTISMDEKNKKRIIEIHWEWEFKDEIEEFSNSDENLEKFKSYYVIEIIGNQI